MEDRVKRLDVLTCMLREAHEAAERKKGCVAEEAGKGGGEKVVKMSRTAELAQRLENALAVQEWRSRLTDTFKNNGGGCGERHEDAGPAVSSLDSRVSYESSPVVKLENEKGVTVAMGERLAGQRLQKTRQRRKQRKERRNLERDRLAKEREDQKRKMMELAIEEKSKVLEEKIRARKAAAQRESEQNMKRRDLQRKVATIERQLAEALAKEKAEELAKKKLIQKSIQNTQAMMQRVKKEEEAKSDRKENLQTSSAPASTKPYCFFYQRFGQCRDRSCTYVHDKSKVSICRKFLLQECTDDKCLLAHVYDKKRIPVCNRYMEGICANEQCPFLHVNAGVGTGVCEHFSRQGFCAQGEKCPRLHMWLCPKKLGRDACDKGHKCPFLHSADLFPSSTQQCSQRLPTATEVEDRNCSPQHLSQDNSSSEESGIGSNVATSNVSANSDKILSARKRKRYWEG